MIHLWPNAIVQSACRLERKRSSSVGVIFGAGWHASAGRCKRVWVFLHSLCCVRRRCLLCGSRGLIRSSALGAAWTCGRAGFDACWRASLDTFLAVGGPAWCARLFAGDLFRLLTVPRRYLFINLCSRRLGPCAAVKKQSKTKASKSAGVCKPYKLWNSLYSWRKTPNRKH